MVAQSSSRERIGKPKRGLRAVVAWRPDVNDPDDRARLAVECRRLARLTREEDAIASDFASLAQRTEGWR
jgi:hypothetical protein